MTKNQTLIEHVIITFFEAVIAYVSVNQTNLSGNAKGVAIGAVGLGLSAAYNVLRQSNPTIFTPTYPQPPVAPDKPLNGVTQLTQGKGLIGSPDIAGTPVTPTEIPTT